MKFIIGIVIVLGAVAGGYLPHGDPKVLWQPLEFVIIVGAAIGAFVISNPGHVIKASIGGVKKLLKGSGPFKKEDYLELLSFIYTMTKLMKTKGMLEVEGHIEDPHSSDIFAKFPGVLHNHHAVDFFSDNLRMLTMGISDVYQMDDLMTEELDIHHEEDHAVEHALTLFAEGMPALGIVAAVLGVITTMQSITEPPEILGGLIGAALVGTFAGILLSYGIFSPIASAVGQYNKAGSAYMSVIKVAILNHMKGSAPAATVEFARKSVPSIHRPTFKEMEEALESL